MALALRKAMSDTKMESRQSARLQKKSKRERKQAMCSESNRKDYNKRYSQQRIARKMPAYSAASRLQS